MTGTVGKLVTPAPEIRVRDGNARPVHVALRLEVNAGTVTEETATDGEGRLRVEDWELGEVAGEQTLTAWVGDEVLVTIRAEARPDAPATFSGFDFQEVVAGDPVEPTTGQIADLYGNPIAELEVEVRRGSDPLAHALTGPEGEVELGGWPGSEIAGVDSLELWSAEGAALTDLVVPIVAGAPEALRIEAQPPEEFRAGEVLSEWGTAAVVDAFGNAVAGPELTFSVTAGSLDDHGEAPESGVWELPAWDLGSEVGPGTLRALSDAFADSIVADIAPGRPAVLQLSASVPDTARSGDTLDEPATVTLTDAFENPVPGVAVTARVLEGAPEIIPGEVVTDDDGIAHFEQWAVGLGREAVRFEAEELESEPISLTGVLDDDAFQLSGLYMNQGNNRPGGAPAIRHRPGQIRVLGHLTVDVPLDEVRIYVLNGGTVLEEVTHTGALPTTAPNPQLGGAGWSVALRSEDVQPGLAVEVELRAGGERVGSHGPVPLEVADVPILRKYFVPIYMEQLGTTGPIEPGTVAAATRDISRWMPINEMEVVIGPVLSTDRAMGGSLSDYSDWSELLRDLWDLRMDLIATGQISPDTYIHGILPTSIPGSGIGGVGYRPSTPGSTALASLSRMNPGTIAHELGHNMGRRHTPCGNPSNARSFPHVNARIGYPGYDVQTGATVEADAADYMSYCGPRWTSDVKFTEVFQWRNTPQYRAMAALPAAVEPANNPVLVHGEVTTEGTSLRIRRATGVPVPASEGGDGILTAMDLDGEVLGEWDVELVEMADAGAPVRHFARAVDLPPNTETLRFEGADGRAAELQGGMTAAALDVAAHVTATGDGVRVTWDADQMEDVTVHVGGVLRGTGSAGSLFIPDANPEDLEVTGTAGLHLLPMWPR